MFEHAIARVRGLRGRLFGRRGLADLIAQPGRAGRLEELLRRAGLMAPAESDVGRALRRRLAADVAKLLALFDETRPGVTLRALARLDEGQTLKTILRGVERGEPRARLLRLVQPGPDLDEGALKELCAQPDVRGVVNLLATWGHPAARPLEDALAPKVRDLPALETALERFLFARARAAAARDPIAAAHVGTLIDLTNAETLVKLGAAASPLFIPGGTWLGAARFARLAGLPPAGMHAALAADRHLGLGAGFVNGVAHPVLFERARQRRLRASLRRATVESPLSIAVPLAYWLDRREEVRAVALVVEGGDLGMPAADLAVLAEAGGVA